MKSTSLLLGYLGKSGTKTNTPELGDTKITIPGLFQPSLEITFPFFSFYSAAQGQLTPINSWAYSEEVGMNAGALLVDLMVLGPGLWDIRIRLAVIPAGATDDTTCSMSIDYFAIDGTGSTVRLCKVVCTDVIPQIQEMQFRQLVTADQLYQFRAVRVLGAGTGTNLAYRTILASRLF